MPLLTKKIISFDEGKRLYDNYSKGNYSVLKSNSAHPDGRSTWYSIDELQAYLDYLNSKMPDMDTSEIGLRLYMGTYGEKELIDGKDVSNLTTVFLYPTKEMEDVFISGSGLAEDIGYDKSKPSPPF